MKSVQSATRLASCFLCATARNVCARCAFSRAVEFGDGSLTSSEAVQSTLIADWIEPSKCGGIAGDKADVSSPQTAYRAFCASLDNDAACPMALIVHRKDVSPRVHRSGSLRDPGRKSSLALQQLLEPQGSGCLGINQNSGTSLASSDCPIMRSLDQGLRAIFVIGKGHRD